MSIGEKSAQKVAGRNDHRETVHLAGFVLTSFLVTFLASRIIVYLIISHRIPDLFLYVGGTHVHHLNYGIFLLSGVGALLLFRHLEKRALLWAGITYGVGLGLTYDEFGMWLHLGGNYWQRASFDAVGIIAAALALIACSPPVRQLRFKHFVVGMLLLGAMLSLGSLVVERLERMGKRMESTGERVKPLSPP